jgi:nucleoside-diphosphate-sugar epimerase
MARARVEMAARLLDAVAAGATPRIVYVADASCYAATGPRAITEDQPPRPSAWGRHLAPALDRVDGYLLAGVPIITAYQD